MPSYAEKIAKLKAAQAVPVEESKPVEVLKPAGDTEPELESQPELNEEGFEPESPGAFLQQLPNSPSKEQIDTWKLKFPGGVFLLALKEDDMYVWKYLERKEWLNIQTQIKVANPEDAEAFVQEQVLARCVLWPRDAVLGAEGQERAPAGLKDLLFEIIMAGSYFIAPEQAMKRVAKL